MFEQFFSKGGVEVSRETVEKFRIYRDLLLKWQRAINLVSETTLDDLVRRHFLDSAQLITHIPNRDITMVDLGSGAGFPGLVLAILGVKEVHLVESDVRKATFLREVSRETQTPVTVHDERIEDVKIPHVDLVTARALAALPELLKMAYGFAPEGKELRCLFLKGEKAQEEAQRAGKKWQFDLAFHPSITDEEGRILEITHLRPL